MNCSRCSVKIKQGSIGEVVIESGKDKIDDMANTARILFGDLDLREK